MIALKLTIFWLLLECYMCHIDMRYYKSTHNIEHMRVFDIVKLIGLGLLWRGCIIGITAAIITERI